MKLSKQSILCVDDNKDNLELMTFVFENDGFDVTACKSLEDCLSEIRQNHFAAIILDNRFGNRSSVEVCKEIRSLKPTTPIVFYSGEARQVEIDKALQACGDAYLVKPLGLDILTETVNRLIKKTQPNL